MIDHPATHRARILALTFAAFGAMSTGCGGSSEPAPAQSSSAQSSGGETGGTQPAQGETPNSTQGTTSADTSNDTACGHGACT